MKNTQDLPKNLTQQSLDVFLQSLDAFSSAVQLQRHDIQQLQTLLDKPAIDNETVNAVMETLLIDSLTNPETTKCP